MAETTTRLQIREAVAADLRQFFRSTIQAVNAAVITVDQMRDFAPDRYRLKDGYLWIQDGQWRRVGDFNSSTGEVTLNRAFNPQPSASDPVAWYGSLEPPEYDKSIDDALTDTARREMYETAVVAQTWDYAMPTWVFSKDDLVQIRLRYAPSGAAPQEYPVAHIKRETANGVTVQLAQLPITVADYTLVVEAKRRYAPLASDAATTTCPLALARYLVGERVAERILHEVGGEARQNFGVSMTLIRERATEARRKLLNIAAQRDFQVGHTAHIGPEVLWDGPGW